MKRTTAAILFAGLVGIGSVKAVANFMEYLDIDKYIQNPIAMAGSTATAKKTPGVQSMEGMLEEAGNASQRWSGDNSALWFSSDFYSFDNVKAIIEDAEQHAHEVGLLDEAYMTGTLPKNSPRWVKLTFEGSRPRTGSNLAEQRLVSSELGAIVQTTYEAFNDVVSGGVNASGEKVTQDNLALIDQMEHAADKAFWSPVDVDMVPMSDAWAHTYTALLYSGMGKLDIAVEYLQKAHDILDRYNDDTDLTIFRSNMKTYQIGTLKAAVNSGIHEFSALDSIAEDQKYTAGWWGLVQKKSESLGASNVYIGDMVDRVGGKYGAASLLWLTLGLVGGAFSAHKYQNAN